MSDEWNKGYFSTGPQHSHEARQGQFARQQEQQREREAAARAAREREQRFQDQMIREAIWSASRPAGIDEGRIFGGSSRRGTSSKAQFATAALVVLFVFFGWNGSGTMPTRAVPVQHQPPPPAVNSQAEPVPVDALNALNASPASVADRSASAPPMPAIDRFALRKAELATGDNLDLVVSWQLPDGARRAAAMDAFIVTRDAARQRTPLLERWSVFPGESTLPLALPAGILPGKYELETVWTLGGEAREMRTHFTLLERPVTSSVGTPVGLPPTQAPAHAAVATLAPSPPPVAEPPPTPPAEQAPAAREPVLPVTGASPPARARTPANDSLYTGG